MTFCWLPPLSFNTFWVSADTLIDSFWTYSLASPAIFRCWRTPSVLILLRWITAMLSLTSSLPNTPKFFRSSVTKLRPLEMALLGEWSITALPSIEIVPR